VTPIKYGSKTMEDDQQTVQVPATMDTGPIFNILYGILEQSSLKFQ